MNCKKVVLGCVIPLLFSFSLFSKDCVYTYVLENGKTINKTVNENAVELILDTYSLNIKEIKGLEKLTNVKRVEIYKLDTDNYSFLSSLPFLESLYICMGKLDSLDVIKNAKNMKEITLDGGVTESFAKKINDKEEIDLSIYPYLKSFSLSDKAITCVPNIKVLSNDITLGLRDCSIEAISEEEMEILKSFKKIDISHNPVCDNPVVLQDFRRRNISYKAYH